MAYTAFVMQLNTRKPARTVGRYFCQAHAALPAQHSHPPATAAGELTNEHTNKRTNKPTNKHNGSQYLLAEVTSSARGILRENF